MANKKAKGKRGRSRSKMTNEHRHVLTVNKMLADFDVDDRVQIDIEPSVHRAIPLPKLQGLVGIVTSKEGSMCKVSVKRGNQVTSIVVHPVHLKKLM